jgi:hypothetical protein
MRKKQPSRQAYARHVRGQSGSPSSPDEERRVSRIDGEGDVVEVDRGKLASLPLRLSFSNDCEGMVAELSILAVWEFVKEERVMTRWGKVDL